MLWRRVVFALAKWALLWWGVVSGLVILILWILAKYGLIPPFNFFRGWILFYAITATPVIAIVLAHFDWWPDEKKAERNEE